MRKITAFLLCAVFFLAAFPSMAAEKVSAEMTNVNTNHLNVVKKLGIMDAFVNFEVDETALTRGEFANVLANLMNLSAEEDGRNIFADVDKATPYYAQIMLMADLGILVGDNENLFCPKESVTYAQAAKCLLYVLGYSAVAEKNGGYPTGYFMQASRLGLFDGLGGELAEKLTRSAMAEMVYNALDITISDIVVIGDSVKYSDEAEETILTKYFHIKKDDGIITSVDGRSIKTRETVSKEGFIGIDDTLYEYDDASIAEYLGYHVEYYATDNEGEINSLLLVFPHKKNRELIIPVKNLNTNDADFSLTNFCYTDNFGKEEEAQLTDKLRFVYNGAYDYDFDLSDLDFDTGYVKLIDQDNDEIYDVVLAWSYENFVVDSVGSNTIICKYNRAIKKDDDVTYRVLASNGVWSGWNELTKLSAWDVLSVAISKDGSLVTVYISSGGIGGTVEGVSCDDDTTEIVVNGNSYVVSSQYPKLRQNSGYVEIKAGLASEFYFDIMGEIAGVYEAKTGGEQYGFLLGIMKKGSLNSEYRVKIFTKDAKIIIFDTKEKIKVTSPSYAGKTMKCEEAFAEFYDGGAVEQQLIRFSADEENTLLSIEKAYDATFVGYDVNHFSKDFVTDEAYRYQDATSTFGDKSSYTSMFHAESAVVFYMPLDGGKVSEEDVSITDKSIFGSNGSYQNMEVYDCDDTYQAKVIVYTPAVGGSAANTTSEYYFYVAKVFVGLDDEGNSVNKVSGWYRGAEKEFEYVSQGGYVPEKGSIIRYVKKTTGELVVSADYLVYSPTTTKSYFRDKSEALPLEWSQYGRIFRKNGAALAIYDGEPLPMANYLNSSYSGNIYKIRKNKLTKAQESDLISSTATLDQNGNIVGSIDGTLIVANNRYQYIREIFIIEED